MNNQKRYYVLDAIRGFALLNMIVYHLLWDFVYLFGFDWQWYHSKGAYLWQQCICMAFILLSGFCQPFGRRKLKRGVCVFFWGFMISAVTWTVMPNNRVTFGILTLIGSCMLLMVPLERLLKRCPPSAGILVSLSLFILTRHIDCGYLGLGSLKLLSLPSGWYRSLVSACLGFPPPGFFSTDYFPLLPWLFLFVCGYFLNLLFSAKNRMHYLEKSRNKAVEWIGRHTLPVYIIHQPALYLMLSVLFSFF